MKEKILIHTIVFSPDGVSTAYLYNDIARQFSNKGYEVVVLTTTPHYNIVEAEVKKQPLVSKWGGIFYQSNFYNIKVIHVPQRKFRSPVLRIVGFVYWHILSLLLGLREKNISLILSPSPPLTIGLINILIAKLKKAKVIYNVQEIYPDLLINHGSLTFKPAIEILRKLEKFVYDKSCAVTTIDTVIRDSIKNRFKNASKLYVIPNFVDTTIFRPIEKINEKIDTKLFPEKKGTLKLMYAGNIGYAQDWLPLLKIAKELKNQHVEFWIVGEGVLKSYLKNEIQNRKISNIHLLDYQSRDLMPYLINYADLHFIFMSPNTQGEGFPSKVYTIMACAKPLIVISKKNTPIYNFLNSNKCAFLLTTQNFEEKVSQVNNLLLKVVNNKKVLDRMGQSGYKLIKNTYSNSAVIDQYINLAERVLKR